MQKNRLNILSRFIMKRKSIYIQITISLSIIFCLLILLFLIKFKIVTVKRILFDESLLQKMLFIFLTWLGDLLKIVNMQCSFFLPCSRVEHVYYLRKRICQSVRRNRRLLTRLRQMYRDRE